MVDQVLHLLNNTSITLDDLLSREDQRLLLARLEEAERQANSDRSVAFRAGWDAHVEAVRMQGPLGARRAALSAFLDGSK